MENSITELVDYSKDPEYVMECVKAFLKCKLRKSPAENWCVVMDIDETLLYTLEDTEEVALQPVGRAIYSLCRRLKLDVVLITARVANRASRDYLLQQLETLDYADHAALFMVDKQHEDDDSPAACKFASRMEYGKPVLLNVGNRCCDLFTVDEEMDPVLASLNPKAYYFFVGQEPDVLALKLPTDCPQYETE